MPGVMGIGTSLTQGAIQGLDSQAGLEAQRDEAGMKMQTEAQGNAINTAGSAAGVIGAGMVKMKKSGILNDIF